MVANTVIVVGAGVVGLSNALHLQTKGFKVEIIAAAFADDIHDEITGTYTSKWAGAHHVSIATSTDSLLHRLDKRTFEILTSLLQVDETIPIMVAGQTELRQGERVFDENGEDMFTCLESYHPQFRMLEKEELSESEFGCVFSTLTFDTPKYLDWLLQVVKSQGGRITRKKLSSLSSALDHSQTPKEDVVAIFNCSGIGAKELVDDEDVYPTRGQTVLVRAPWLKSGITRVGPKGSGIYTYVIPRKSGDVILGGTSQDNDYSLVADSEIREQILTRCLELCPDLIPPSLRSSTPSIADIDVIEADNVGLRPSRKGAGLRIELEVVEGITVVHCYGHAGYGFQSSLGSAEMTVELLEEYLGRN